jgi:hypothetical protein
LSSTLVRGALENAREVFVSTAVVTDAVEHFSGLGQEGDAGIDVEPIAAVALGLH